ncbi:MAG: hypothetical protein ABL308_09985 [Oceanicaulis sp.]
MTDPIPARARFSAGAALGYAWVIFRSRPASFFRLWMLHALLFAAYNLAVYAVMGTAGLQTGGSEADQFAALMRANAYIMLVSLGGVIVTVWIEAAWLDLFLNRPVKLLPGWGVYFKLLAAFLIVFAVFLGGYLGTVFLGVIVIAVAAGLGGAGPAIALGAAVLAGFIAFLVLVLMRFTALPALAAGRDEVAPGRAWSLTRGRMGALFLAWLAYGVIYLIGFAVMSILLLALPVSPLEALGAALESPADPMAQYEIYARLLTQPGAAVATFFGLLVMNLVFVPIMAIARGIGVRLALEDAEAQA